MARLRNPSIRKLSYLVVVWYSPGCGVGQIGSSSQTGLSDAAPNADHDDGDVNTTFNDGDSATQPGDTEGDGDGYDVNTDGDSADATPPVVSITSPAPTTYTTVQTVTITAIASDNVGVIHVDLYDGLTLKGSRTTSPYQFAWSITSADNGSHGFTARAFDAAGNNASSTVVSLTVNIQPASVWDVTIAPPAMSNPTTITLPGTYLGTIEHPLCTGPGYVVDLDNNTDYIIGTNAVLHDPVQINGGRNVRIVGLHIDLDTAACADAGPSGYAPGVIALRTAQVGTTFIEGAYIDVRGRATDCIDPRNLIGNFEALSKGYNEADARGARDVVIQNSVCRGMSGDVNVHGDIAQTQGLYELYRNIVLENVSADSNCEGTVFEPRQGYYVASSIAMRRFDYRVDARYTPNPNGGGFWTGGAVMHAAEAYSYDRVYIVNFGGDDVVREFNATETATTYPSCDGSTGVFCGSSPPENRYASPGTGDATSDWTGINYVSPHP